MKNKILSIIVLSWGALGMVLLPACSLALSLEQAHEHFQKGNGFYKEGKFGEACSEYESIPAAGISSGEVYYNIGNCYAKRGMLGFALLNYERARLCIPQDSDLKANYEFIRSELALSGVSQGFWAQLLDGINDTFSITLLARLLLILYVALFVCIGIYAVYGSSRKVVTPVIAGICVILVLGVCAWQRKRHFIDRGAIIITKDVPARFEPSEGGTVYFTLPEGSRIEVLESADAWAKVVRSDGKIGWINKTSFERIAP